MLIGVSGSFMPPSRGWNAVSFPEMSASIYHILWCNIAEDSDLYAQLCENHISDCIYIGFNPVMCQLHLRD
jgi:hypothetical protein